MYTEHTYSYIHGIGSSDINFWYSTQCTLTQTHWSCTLQLDGFFPSVSNAQMLPWVKLAVTLIYKRFYSIIHSYHSHYNLCSSQFDNVSVTQYHIAPDSLGQTFWITQKSWKFSYSTLKVQGLTVETTESQNDDESQNMQRLCNYLTMIRS